MQKNVNSVAHAVGVSGNASEKKEIVGIPPVGCATGGMQCVLSRPTHIFQNCPRLVHRQSTDSQRSYLRSPS